jgi:RND family efflux transporter MFP subunit
MKVRLQDIFVAALAATTLSACSRQGDGRPSGPPPAQVVAFTIHPEHAVYFDSYPATVTALNQVDLRPEVSGYIEEISFQDGQHVRKGMPLYSIDRQLYKAAYDQANANLNVARANLAKVQQDVDRYTELARHNAVARQTLEHATADLQSAKMQVVAAEASVKSSETNLRYAVITAPFDGVIGISLVKRGSAVTAGQTLLNTISSDDPIGVDCSVDEKEIDRFTDLLRHDHDRKDSIFTIVLPDQTVYPSVGRLLLLDRAVDPETGTIRIRLTFPNPKELLRPGLTCDLRVKETSSATSVLVPGKAVVEQMGEYFVYVIQQDRAKERRVIIGEPVGNMIIVREGLRVGEQVVTDGVQRLRNDALVTVLSSPAEAADSQAQAGMRGAQ